MPWTISYVIRKRMQLDSYNELPKEKRPPDHMIWWGIPEEIDDWFDKVLGTKNKNSEHDIVLEIDPREIE